MGNYCNGTITVSGPKETLDLLYALTERLDDCASVSRFDADADFLLHIFKEEYSTQGIFYEGGGMNDDGTLELYIRASRTDGRDFFQDMASGIGCTIKWVYVDDYDGREHRKTCKPKKDAPVWEFRTLEELDPDWDDARATDDASSSKVDTWPGTSWGNKPASSGGFHSSFDGKHHIGGGSFQPDGTALLGDGGSYVYQPGGVGRMNLLGQGAGTTAAGFVPFGAKGPTPANSGREPIEAVLGRSAGTSGDKSSELSKDLGAEVYQHCLFASILGERLHGVPNTMQRSRIVADIYIAADAMLRLTDAAFSTGQKMANAQDIGTLSRHLNTLRGWLVVPASILPYSVKVPETVDYEAVWETYSCIQRLLAIAAPNYASALVGLILPRNLW